MITREELKKLSHEQKDDLIISLFETINELKQHILKLEARIAELEDQLSKPKKSSNNSSKPSSKEFKKNKKEVRRDGPRQGSLGRKGSHRELHPNPDETIAFKVENCPGCHSQIQEKDQSLYQEYDHIKIPKKLIHVSRIQVYEGSCPCCGLKNIAQTPEGLAYGSPFDASVVETVLYLRYGHHVGYKRIAEILSHLYGLEISQGAVDNMLRRSKIALDKSVTEILAEIRISAAISSDETSARVKGKNEWEWTFVSQKVTLHVIRPSRGAQVVEEVLNGHVPEVWGADLYSAQRGHAKTFQACLAHQIRDCQYAIDSGDETFAGALKRLFQESTSIAKRIPDLKPGTIKSYGYKLNHKLDKILMMKPKTKAGEKLLKRYKKERAHLFTFLEDPRIPPTNNVCERALRTSVIYRKITNGFRSDWGKELYAAVRSVVNTGRQNNLNPAQAISLALAK